jgi:hypothetical protein
MPVFRENGCAYTMVSALTENTWRPGDSMIVVVISLAILMLLAVSLVSGFGPTSGRRAS